MLKVIMTEEKFHELMSFYTEERNYGKLKYFWQLSVPDEEEISFCCWLDKCEKLGLTFAFAVIERYKGHKLMYGFSDFEIPERKRIKCMQLYFENQDILYQQFMECGEESEYFILPISLKITLEVCNRLSGNNTNFQLYDDGTLEQSMAINSTNYKKTIE